MIQFFYLRDAVIKINVSTIIPGSCQQLMVVPSCSRYILSQILLADTPTNCCDKIKVRGWTMTPPPICLVGIDIKQRKNKEESFTKNSFNPLLSMKE